MPILKGDGTPTDIDLSNASAINSRLAAKEAGSWSGWSLARDALTTDNATVAGFQLLTEGSDTPKDVNFDIQPKLEEAGLTGYAKEFSDVFNDVDMDERVAKITKQIAAESNLEKAGGFGTAARVAASIFSAESFVPGGNIVGAASKAGALLAGAKVGAMALGMEAVGETMLVNNNATRSAEGIVGRIAVNSIGAGVLGGSLSKFLGRAKRTKLSLIEAKKNEDFTELMDLEDVLNAAEDAPLASTVKGKVDPDTGEVIQPVGEGDFDVKVRDRDPEDVDIGQTVDNIIKSPGSIKDMKESQAEGTFGLSNILWSINGTGIRSKNPATRNILKDLTRTSLFRKEESAGVATQTAETKVKVRINNGTKVIKAILDIGKKSGMPSKEFHRAVLAKVSGSTNEVSDAVGKAAIIYKKQTDDLFEQLRVRGLVKPETKIDDYVTRLYDVKYIKQNMTTFRSLLKKEYTRGLQQRGNTTELENIDRYVESSISKILGDGANSRVIEMEGDALKGRVLSLSDLELGRFLIRDDIAKTLQSSVIKMSRAVEGFDFLRVQEKSLGLPENSVKGIDDLIDRLNDTYDELKSIQPTSAARAKIVRDQKSAIIAIRSAHKRVIGEGISETGNWSKASTTAREVNLMVSLGSVTASAIPDAARLFGMPGVKASSVVKLLSGFVFRTKEFKIKRDEARKLIGYMETMMNARMRSIADVGADEIGLSDVSKKGTELFGALTGMTMWNDTMKGLAGMLTMEKITNSAARIAAGKQNKTDVRNLANLGISPDAAAKIHQDISRYKTAEVDMWSQETRDLMDGAILTEMDNTIVTPGAGQTPVILDHPLGKMGLQFKGFLLAANESMLAKGVQQRDGNMLLSLMLATGLGYVVNTLKNTIDNKPPPKDDLSALADAFDRTGYFAMMAEVANLASTTSEAFTGVSFREAMGLEAAAKFRNRTVSDVALGATGGYVQRAVETLPKSIQIKLAGDDLTEEEEDKLLKLIPYASLPYVRALITNLDNGE